MELEDLFSSLTINGGTDPLNHIEFQVLTEQHPTDITLEEYTDYYLLLAKQEEGTTLVATKVSMHDDTVIQSNIICANHDSLQAAQFIAKALNLNKPLWLFLCMRNYEDQLISELTNGLIWNLSR
ncbi:hypothetical protein ILUMI_10096 [Ignelater luminosus]|uniref:Uncharacterized protein n=1 Tax=Ignelater luminosus TaxID=2038154 RepID=A0A8K0D7T7_IGNLU|nr:hypothetical protein ILUMI_10096 [Ignelater luminosus]